MKELTEIQQRSVKAQYAQIDLIQIYEVQDTELEQISKGSSGGLFLNFGIFFLSSALSLLVALITGTFTNSTVFLVLVVITVVSMISALVLLSLWWRKRGDLSEMISKIKARSK